MAISSQLLEILVCPDNRTPVRLADQQLIDRINEGIAAGRVVNRRGDAVRDKIDGGLVREDGKLLYPIRDDIPVMLIDEGIPICEGQTGCAPQS